MHSMVEYAVVSENRDISNISALAVDGLYSNVLGRGLLLSAQPVPLNEDGFFEGIALGDVESKEWARGAFSHVSANDAAIEIRTDYLGLRPLYYYHDDNLNIVSNSIAVMKSCLDAFRRSVQVNYMALASTFCMGNLQTPETPLDGVYLLPIGHYIKITDAGLQIIKIPKTTGSLTDCALKDRAIDELFENFKMAIQGHEHIIVETTGGLDSRICLALALSLGFASKIKLLTRGGPEHADRVCAERIAYAYDLDFINSPYRNELIDDSTFQNSGKFCAGVRWFDDVSFRMRTVNYDFAVITGGCGEIFRNFYCDRLFYNCGKTLNYFNQIFTEQTAGEYFDLMSSKTNFLAPGIELKAYIVEYLLAGKGTIGEVLFDQYNGFRNRLHHGGATAARSRVFNSFEPLYTVAGYELAKRKDIEWQIHGEFSFDLINEIFPALNTFPLAEKIIPPHYLSSAKERLFFANGYHKTPGLAPLKVRPSILNLPNDMTPAGPPANNVVNSTARALIENPIVGNLLLIDKVKEKLVTEYTSMEKAAVSPLVFLNMFSQ